MPVALDAVAPGTAGQSAVSGLSLSWSHTCTGSNRCVFVGFVVGQAGGNFISATMSATYGGTAMTAVVASRLVSGTSNTGRFGFWYLIGPPTGASTINVSVSAGTPDSLIGGSVSFTGVDQATPIGTPVNNNSSADQASCSAAMGTIPTGNMVIDLIGTGSSISSTTQTQRWLKNNSVNSIAGNAAASTAVGAGAAITMSYAHTLDGDSITGVEIRAAAATPLILQTPQLYTARRRATLW
jgi:hypothetical protein